MWFRALTILVALGIWATLFWFSNHESADPRVLGRYSVAYAAGLAALLALAVAATLAQRARMHERIHRHRVGITLLSGTVLFTVAAAEGGIRLLDPLGISHYEEVKTYQMAKLPDADLVYRHPANWQVRLQGVEVKTNEIGLRDRPIVPKRTGELRVLVLGDSITFGWGVAVEATFARRLEPLLEQRTGGPARVINSGVGSYNTEQEVAFLRRGFDTLAPDLVLMVVVDNDDDVHPQPFVPTLEASELHGKQPPEAVRILLGRLWLYRMVAHVASLRAAPLEVAAVRSEGWKRMRVAFADFAAFCAAKRLPCVATMYRLLPKPKTDTMLGELREVFAAPGIPVLDTAPWFSGSNIKALRNSVVDSHPNAEGHRMLAEGLLPALVAARSSR